MRAEFRVWHQGEHCQYRIFGECGPEPVRKFPIATRKINTLMEQLATTLQGCKELRRKLFQVNFKSALGSDETMISLIYHRRLDSAWEAAARKLATVTGSNIVGRSRGQQCLVGTDYITESLTIDGTRYSWRQPENCFSQPNAATNRCMLEWAGNIARQIDGGDLLELYCGYGNFTAVLARYYTRALATESTANALRTARENLATNGIGNVSLARLHAHEVCNALDGQRPFRRLAEIDLAGFRFSTILVDPPRSGLDAQSCHLLSRFPHAIYFSCNPETMVRDLRKLPAIRIRELALFDQFPYTEHCECAVGLENPSAAPVSFAEPERPQQANAVLTTS